MLQNDLSMLSEAKKEHEHEHEHERRRKNGQKVFVKKSTRLILPVGEAVFGGGIWFLREACFRSLFLK
jgi:hypothetical protein